MQLLTGPWPARLTWAALPLLLGPPLGEALDPRSRAVALTGAALAWGSWAAGLVAVALPSTASLTALRLGAPTALAAAVWAALQGEGGAGPALAVLGGSLLAVAAFSPFTGEAFVNGSSYGDERRLPLRVPAPLLLGPLPLAAVAAVAGPIAGPLLLAAEQWVLGAVVLAAGGAAAVVAVRALHGLSRRWVVLVPAGLVLHDLHTMVDPVLFPRARVRRLGPAPVEDAAVALDLTARSLGLALELELSEPTQVAPRRRDGEVQVVEVERLLFTPTRPGALLAAAAQRRIAVG
jgi:hypothetical protein